MMNLEFIELYPVYTSEWERKIEERHGKLFASPSLFFIEYTQQAYEITFRINITDICWIFFLFLLFYSAVTIHAWNDMIKDQK